MDKGIYYTNAHYQHANTETIVGHATGTFPSQHGMVGNVWFDREAGELAYNIEAPNGSSPGSSGGCRADNCCVFGNDTARFRTRVAA